MHKIYFEKRCIIICHEGESALSDPNAVEFRFGESVSIHSLVAMFKAGESLGKVYIPTDDTEWMYRRVCAEFKEVEAAGGLVSNRRGDLLLINRNGLWDLPKGHREKGESISTTALREVAEETGIDKLELRSLICVTDHCYLRDGIWHLKPAGPQPPEGGGHRQGRLDCAFRSGRFRQEQLSVHRRSFPRSENLTAR